MPRQKVKPSPNVSLVGRMGDARRPKPKPPNPPPNCAAATPAVRTTSAAARNARFTPGAPRLFLRRLWGPGERTVVLGDLVAEAVGHVVGAGDRDRVLLFDLATERKLDALGVLGNQGLQPRQLGDVLVDPRIVEILQRTEHFLHLLRIDFRTLEVLAAQLAAEALHLVGVLTRLIPQLPDVFFGQVERLSVPPTAPPILVTAVGAATVVATSVFADAAIRVAAVIVTATTAALTVLRLLPLALLAALPLLTLLTTLALLAALTLLALLSLLAILTLLALTLLALLPLLAVLRLLLPVLALLPALTLLALLALLPLLAVLALCVLRPALTRPLGHRIRATREAAGAIERLLTRVALLVTTLADGVVCFVEPLPHVIDAARDVVLRRIQRLR